MDDSNRSDASLSDTEAHVVAGWSALERRDLPAARAALQDLYSADPTHPALPLLAAGIRRVRPMQVPWRAAVLLVVVVGVGLIGVRAWTRDNRREMTPAQHTSPTVSNSASSTRSIETTAAEVGNPMGTAGHIQPAALPANKPTASPAPIDEDVVVRQSIKRFELSYGNRWGNLAFSHCDVSREVDQATATCIPRAAPDTAEPAPDRMWTFSLRKTDGSWRITSVQPPVALQH